MFITGRPLNTHSRHTTAERVNHPAKGTCWPAPLSPHKGICSLWGIFPYFSHWCNAFKCSSLTCSTFIRGCCSLSAEAAESFLFVPIIKGTVDGVSYSAVCQYCGSLAKIRVEWTVSITLEAPYSVVCLRVELLRVLKQSGNLRA